MKRESGLKATTPCTTRINESTRWADGAEIVWHQPPLDLNPPPALPRRTTPSFGDGFSGSGRTAGTV